MAEYHYSNYIERPVPEGSAKFSTDTVDVQLYQALLRSLAWRMTPHVRQFAQLFDPAKLGLGIICDYTT